MLYYKSNVRREKGFNVKGKSETITKEEKRKEKKLRKGSGFRGRTTLKKINKRRTRTTRTTSRARRKRRITKKKTR